jgi:hypothetical protein
VVIEWTNDKIMELIALVRLAGVLAAVAMVALAYIKTRSLVTVLVAALTAGFFLWTIHSTTWLQERVQDEETRQLPRPAVVEVVVTSDQMPFVSWDVGRV